jgi:tetratricopeptide (TPR) repeat protein
MSEMMLELTLSFSSIDCVTVTLTNRSPISIPFTSPFTKADWEDMQWYIESYPVQYAADVDDDRAARIVSQLKTWGQGLFNAVFEDRAAERIFNEFQDAEGEGRQISIAASQPEILRLPWELLCDPNGTYLVHEQPRIAIRRQLAGAGGGRKPVEVKPKAQLRLLMVVSRPDGAGFIDPRSEAQAVLQAIEQTAPGRVVVEFLRPATLTKLVERLEHKKLPAIDIVHFDGHGTFATNGAAGTGKHDDGLSKGSQPQGMGYLVFEDEDGKKKLISAEELGEALNRQKVSLMVLSAWALPERRMLIILDNLESLAAETLQELLTVAKEWSQVGATRLLLTTRDGGLSHADYPAANSRLHQLLSLSGLGNERHPEDALRYFQGLMKLPPVPKWDLPERAALIELFKLVDFHPLSIKLVAYQLKERRVGDLARSLEQLLAAEPLADKQRCLVASLNLSLERLDTDLLAVLPRLGVFQGGALEFQILDVLQFEPEQWQKLKVALLRTGLVQVENRMFLRFHPTLAPVLWGRLTTVEQGELRLRHQQKYYVLASALYHFDNQNPEVARIAVRKELANLLWAVNGMLDEQAENAVGFVTILNKFLGNFGLKRDLSFLTERLSRVVGAVGSNSWYLLRFIQAEQLLNAGQYPAASDLFAEILQILDPEKSFDRVKALVGFARCLKFLGKLPAAAQSLDDALKLSEQLEPSDEVKKQRGMVYADLGDVLISLGQYGQAQQLYEDLLAIDKELDNQRSAHIEGQLGTLAMLQGDLNTAIDRYQSVLATSQQLEQPEMEAGAWHQLGMAYQVGMVYGEGQNWELADRAYRKSARINEQQGNIDGAARTYTHLAILNQQQNPFEAEKWYRKALQSYRQIGDQVCESQVLSNLSVLLAYQLNRLPEAHQLATDAFAIMQTLDPAAEIWKIYGLLAMISTAQNKPDKAKEYRQLARTTKAAFAGTQYELQQYDPLIDAVFAAVEDAAVWEQLEPVLVQWVEIGKGQLVTAIQRVVAGERDVEALWDDLDLDDSMIIAAILRGV